MCASSLVFGSERVVLAEKSCSEIVVSTDYDLSMFTFSDEAWVDLLVLTGANLSANLTRVHCITFHVQ